MVVGSLYPRMCKMALYTYCSISVGEDLLGVEMNMEFPPQKNNLKSQKTSRYQAALAWTLYPSGTPRPVGEMDLLTLDFK